MTKKGERRVKLILCVYTALVVTVALTLQLCFMYGVPSP